MKADAIVRNLLGEDELPPSSAAPRKVLKLSGNMRTIHLDRDTGQSNVDDDNDRDLQIADEIEDLVNQARPKEISPDARRTNLALNKIQTLVQELKTRHG